MKHFFVCLLAVAASFSAAVPSHAADGLVCTAVVRSDLSSGVPVPLHNGTRFNCGPQIQNKTIKEISAAGWIIIQVQPAIMAPNEGAWQLVIQK